MPPETSSSVVYEQPLNERVRTLLRLEFLFGQLHHHRSDTSDWGVRDTLRSLLDVLQVLSRGDLKTEILKELGSHHAALTRLQQRPGVDAQRLQSVLAQLSEASNGLQVLTTNTMATLLRDNEFLVSLLHRGTIPGGASAFDIPGYHYWLSQAPHHIGQDLDAWFADMLPFERAVTLLLRLLRDSTEPSRETARAGMFVHTPQTEYELVRVLVAIDAGVYPEISAGRHRFTVRFMSQRDVSARAVQATADISFKLQCCTL